MHSNCGLKLFILGVDQFDLQYFLSNSEVESFSGTDCIRSSVAYLNLRRVISNALHELWEMETILSSDFEY